jgi:hypothetical protein
LTAVLFFPSAQGCRCTQVFLLGGDAAAAFTDELRISDKVGILVGTVLGCGGAIEFTQVLVVIFA